MTIRQRQIRVLVLLVVCVTMCSVLSAQQRFPEPLNRLLEETEAILKVPHGFRPVPVRENPDVRYNFAMTTSDVRMEIRVLFWPLKESIAEHRRTRSPGLNPNTFHEALLMTMCLNLSGEEECRPTPFNTEDVKIEFRADAGFTVLVKLDSEFGQDFRFALINAFHRDDVGDIYVFYLFDDVASVSPILFREDVFHAVTFR